MTDDVLIKWIKQLDLSFKRNRKIIKVLKQKYRKKLVLRYLKKMESKNSAKNLNTLDIHYTMA
jgi:flagellar motility protein MotE (MotC chaperone)